MTDHTDIETPVEGGSHGISVDDDVHLRTSAPVAATDPNQPQSPSEAVAAAEDKQRLDGLPDKFKTTGDLLAGYTQAERKIFEQGQELNQLRAQLEQQAALVAQFTGEMAEAPELAAFSPALAFQDERARQAVEMAARQNVVDQAVQHVPGLAEALTAQVQAPAQHAQAIAAHLDQLDPNWQDFALHLEEARMRSPDSFTHPDPRVVAERAAHVIAGARADKQELERFRTDREKTLAQTAVGAGTRVVSPGDAEAEWAGIREAGTNSYAERMRSK